MYFACHEQLDCLLSLIRGSRFAIYVSTDSAKKLYVSTVSSQARYVSTDSTQAVFISTMFDRGRTFRPSSTEEKHFDRVRPKSFFDREEFRTRKISSTVFYRGKCFDRVQPRSFFRPRWISTEKKNISNVFERGKTFRLRSFFGRKKYFDCVFFAADCRKHIQF